MNNPVSNINGACWKPFSKIAFLFKANFTVVLQINLKKVVFFWGGASKLLHVSAYPLNNEIYLSK